MKYKLIYTLVVFALGATAGAIAVAYSRAAARDNHETKLIITKSAGANLKSSDTISDATLDSGTSDPVEAQIEKSLDFPSEIERLYSFNGIVQSLKRDQFPKIFESLKKMYPYQQRAKFLEILFQRWGEKYPMDALGVVNQVSPRFRSDLTATILKGWGCTDIDAALNWMNQSTPDQNSATKSKLKGAIAAGLVERGKFSTEIQSLVVDTNLTGDSSFAYTIARGWAAKDFDSAVKWVNELPASTALRSNAIKGIVGAILSEDPELAVSYAKGLAEDGDRAIALCGIVEDLQSDGNDSLALAYLINGGADRALDYARMHYISRCDFTSDLEQHMQLLDSIEDVDMKKHTTKSVVSSIKNSNPAKATELILTHYDQQQIDKELPDVLRIWNKKDPSSLSEFFKSANLPDAQKAELAASLGIKNN